MDKVYHISDIIKKTLEEKQVCWEVFLGFV